jgi:hypothetical protein
MIYRGLAKHPKCSRRLSVALLAKFDAEVEPTALFNDCGALGSTSFRSRHPTGTATIEG